jgi:hypothetical protein
MHATDFPALGFGPNDAVIVEEEMFYLAVKEF